MLASCVVCGRERLELLCAHALLLTHAGDVSYTLPAYAGPPWPSLSSTWTRGRSAPHPPDDHPHRPELLLITRLADLALDLDLDRSPASPPT